MSQIRQNIMDTLKTAMKARDQDTVKTLRNLQAVLKKVEIDNQIELDDPAILEIFAKQIKQRQESLAIYTANDRPDLAEKEAFEIKTIQGFMPAPLDEAELLALVKAEIQAQQATSLKDMGKLVSALKAKTVGRADPAVISQLIKKELTQPSA